MYSLRILGDVKAVRIVTRLLVLSFFSSFICNDSGDDYVYIIIIVNAVKYGSDVQWLPVLDGGVCVVYLGILYMTRDDGASMLSPIAVHQKSLATHEIGASC